MIFKLIQCIMVIELLYKFQIDRKSNEEATASGWTILKIGDLNLKNASFSKNNSGRILFFELTQGLMVIKLLYTFQIDLKRNEDARGSGSTIFKIGEFNLRNAIFCQK